MHGLPPTCTMIPAVVRGVLTATVATVLGPGEDREVNARRRGDSDGGIPW
jgi:hypothetical protein